MMRTFIIFNDDPISNVTQRPRQKARQKVEDASSDEILRTSSDDFADYVVQDFELDPLELDLDNPQVTIDDWDDEEPALRFQYAGNERILRLKPSPSKANGYRAEVNEEEGYVDVYFPRRNDGYSDSELQKFQKEIQNYIKKQYSRVDNNLDEFYTRVREEAKSLHEEKKEKIQQQQQRFENLGIEVVRRDNVNEALKIDEPQRRKEITIDEISKEQPGPGISDEIYYEIIEAVDAVGHGFEKSPETYSDFGEEDYRNVMLTFLEMNFEGSATGETFNKDGKSDILLRHDGDNIFIAECGMWAGPQTLSGEDQDGGKISQLLERYLTWRDTKAAVILFVDRDSFSSILEKIPDAVEEHPLCVGLKEKKQENWWQYSFDRPDDSGNQVDVALLAFDVATDG
ncbi:hypothetical protein [Halobacterium litoreum]|uniref:Uncharacterized protein n=1 Tax=Halobacterium litoreum TaxID=2039234 RepID=A0ABD5NED6_9EURY|nr:hypothetical protein [Halobacterium litoreum]UHH13396.1 hypothetical protein LT972_00010 [Halobacterium litoreum]